MTEPLKLVSVDDDEDTLVGQVKLIDELVDELIEANENLKEEMEQIRLALGMDRVEFLNFRQNGFVLPRNGLIGKTINGVVTKLEKVLGRV
jgi:hypothetical protein